MTIGRRAGAPRLIEWTGERCVPWTPDVQVVYEHLHRYLWAAQLVGGRRVLDLASGEGFGAAILSSTASSVVGIDIDERTVSHSSLNYGSETISFRLGDAQDLSMFQDSSFGAVVAFEMIEHVERQADVLSEIARVLEPDGLLVISTPERRAYTTGAVAENPFHVAELTLPELQEALGRQFAHRAIFGQRTVTGSVIAATGADDTDGASGADATDGASGAGPARTFFIEPEGDEWALTTGMSALYLVAVASNAPLPQIPRESTLADCDLALLRAAERRGSEAVAAVQRAEREVAEQASAHIAHVEHELSQARGTAADREIELAVSRQRQEQLNAELDEATARADWLAAQLETTAQLRGSLTWRAHERLRDRLLALAGGPRSTPVRAARAAQRALRRRRSPGSRAGADGWVPLHLPAFPRPEVSIVIPLYSGAELTYDALRSILDHTAGASYEVILVDDCADAQTKALLELVHGARIITNETNIGYLRSVKRGAAAARGEWIVLCNNDIHVLEGWLDAMLQCGRSAHDIAIVAPKYLYPDWSLSEAGGIIWRDGSGGNYGRGDDPAHWRYEFRREVDYGSAAALMVRASFWREAGGFDERYVPMYYEDTDLCFRARERGMRVMFEPRANVIHLEGGTAGTDISTGHKRWQAVNQGKFVERWAGALRDQLPPSSAGVHAAANRHRGPHLLIVDHRVPMWDRDSGSLRLHGIIRALLQMGWLITLLPDDRHMTLPYTQQLQAMGVEVIYGDVDPVSELTALAPELDAIITCRPHATTRYLDLLRGAAPRAPVIYDTVDLHWLRESRRAVLSGGEERSPKVVALREVELALIRATDATLVVTEAERAQVLADVPNARVQVVANVNEIQERVPGPHGRRGVVFIGGFEHPPNVEAVLMLVNEVMPRVWRELGDVPVTIVGDSVPPEIQALASREVQVAGWVPDIGPVLDEARAMVAPLTYGAGLKGKVTQALAAGLPVVTTPIGAEGIDARDGEQMLIGQTPTELADRVIRIIADDDLWMRLSADGQEVARAHCSPGLVVQRLTELMDSLGLATRRVRPEDMAAAVTEPSRPASG